MRGAQTKTLLAFAVFQMPSVQDNQNIEVAYFGVACFGVACPLTFSTMWIRVPMVIGIPLMLYSSCFLTSGVPALGWTLVYQQEVRPNKATCLNIERKFCTSLPVFFPKSTFLSIPQFLVRPLALNQVSGWLHENQLENCLKHKFHCTFLSPGWC